MYIVEIINNGIPLTIHGDEQKLYSGSVVKGINSIDSFTFSMLPSNDGINAIRDFQTFVNVYNTNHDRYEFQGRAIYSDVSMDEKGLITKEVTCESYLGYLCDSQQEYVEEKNWTVEGLFKYIIDGHNSQVEDYKQFVIGEVTVTDPNDNLYIGIQRANSWKVITDKLIGTLGGEIRFRVENGVMYLDYLEKIGETKTTEIALSHNMQSIRRSNDPTAYITRLIPLGCKLKNSEGKETEKRLDITSVNGGKNYIDDEEAIKEYGIKVDYATFDDVTVAGNLLNKGREYLEENNKVQVKYSIKALDLSLLGLDIEDFEVYDYYSIINPLLGINDVARIIKKKIDVCEEIKSTIEVGDNFKTLSDIQREQSEQIQSTLQSVKSLEQTTSRLAEETDVVIKEVQQSLGETGTFFLSLLVKSGSEDVDMQGSFSAKNFYFISDDGSYIDIKELMTNLESRIKALEG